MKAVAYHHPVSTTRAVSYSRLPVSTVRPCAAESARGQQRLVDAVNGRQGSATSANQPSRIAQQRPRRNSGPGKHGLPAAKISKAGISRNRIGLWLEKIDPAHGLPPASQALSPSSSETWTRRRSASLGVTSPLDAIRMARDPRVPRVPLADITSLVLAAESHSGFNDGNEPDGGPRTFKMEEPQSPTQPRPFSGPDLTGAVDMLTADEARQLLLMSARSDISLANAIKEIAISRSSIQSTQECDQISLADTFICAEDHISPEP